MLEIDLFQGIQGHEAAKTVLRHALAHPYHAYCLMGPEGVGRHLLAEAFVRGLLGADPMRPLNSHPDIAILERPSSASGQKRTQIPVEAVRHLRSRLSQTPVVANHVVAYVPEVDALNEDGVNALLKYIEEPRAGAVFVCVASQESRLPDTFWSRVHRIRVSRLDHADMVHVLKTAGTSADLQHEVMAFADGRPGFALRYLNDASVREAVHRADRIVDACLKATSAGEAFAAIRGQVEEADAYEDAIQAWRETLHLWGRALRRRFPSGAEKEVHLGQILLTAERALGGPVSPRLFLELGLIRMTEKKPIAFPGLLPSPYPYPIEL